MIPEHIVEEIKARNDIVSVVEQYVTLDKKGSANYFGLCPFHLEKTPSFSVSPSKQIYYCFGCNKGGNVIQFIKEVEKCSYGQALQMLAEKSGIKLPEPDDEAYKKRTELNKQYQQIMLEAARWFYKNLNDESGLAARQYLQKRQISVQTTRKFGLGYAPDRWDGLCKHLQQLGYTDQEILLKSGLFKRSKQGSLIDQFRNRLMFPILDVLGKIVAFGGRVMDDSLPKYINSPETPIYVKGRHLYALNFAKNSREKSLIMVEGYMDAIAMYQAGIDRAVASLGTALTEQQAALMRKYTEHVVVAYDADAAGQAAALRSLDILTDKGLKVTVLQVPDGKDPDEFIRRNGAERFAALIDQALPLLDFKLLVVRRKNTENGQLDVLAYQDEACNILAVEDNAIVRELYADRLAQELQASSDTVLREIERRHSQPAAGKTQDDLRRQLQQQIVQPATEQTEKINREELKLLSLLAVSPDALDRLDPPLRPDDFSEGMVRELAEAFLIRLQSKSLDATTLFDLAEDKMVRGHQLSEWLAHASMKLDEAIGKQDYREFATGLVQYMRLNQLRVRKEAIQQQHQACQDPAVKAELAEQVRSISAEYTNLRTQLGVTRSR